MAKAYQVREVSLPLGGEWDAGVVLRPAGSGRVSVRHIPGGFEIFFHRFSDGVDIVFDRFPSEELAKEAALRVLRDLRR